MSTRVKLWRLDDISNPHSRSLTISGDCSQTSCRVCQLPVRMTSWISWHDFWQDDLSTCGWLDTLWVYWTWVEVASQEVFLLPLDGMLVHRRPLPCNLLGFPNNSLVPIYTPGRREVLWELSVLPKNTTQCPRSGLEPGSLDPRVKHSNHEVTVPPTGSQLTKTKFVHGLVLLDCWLRLLKNFFGIIF